MFHPPPPPPLSPPGWPSRVGGNLDVSASLTTRRLRHRASAVGADAGERPERPSPSPSRPQTPPGGRGGDGEGEGAPRCRPLPLAVSRSRLVMLNCGGYMLLTGVSAAQTRVVPECLTSTNQHCCKIWWGGAETGRLACSRERRQGLFTSNDRYLHEQSKCEL